MLWNLAFLFVYLIAVYEYLFAGIFPWGIYLSDQLHGFGLSKELRVTSTVMFENLFAGMYWQQDEGWTTAL